MDSYTSQKQEENNVEVNLDIDASYIEPEQVKYNDNHYPNELGSRINAGEKPKVALHNRDFTEIETLDSSREENYVSFIWDK